MGRTKVLELSRKKGKVKYHIRTARPSLTGSNCQFIPHSGVKYVFARSENVSKMLYSLISRAAKSYGNVAVVRIWLIVG